MSLFKKSETEKKVDAFIEKHTGKLTAAVIIGLSIWGLSSCMEETTPEEKAASIQSDYQYQCRLWGINYEVSELGGAQKYKDRSLLHYWESQKLAKKHPELTESSCKAEFADGVKEGRARVRAGKVDMKGE